MSHRMLIGLVLFALPAFPVSKEIQQLQRDMALLQDQVNKLNKDFLVQMEVLKQQINQNQDGLGRVNNSLAALERTLQGQQKLLEAPVANINSRIEALTGQFQALGEAVKEMNDRLAKLQQQIADVKSLVGTMPPPSQTPAQPPGGTASAPPGPPPGELFRNAMRDYLAGNYNLAGPEFTDYVNRYGNTPQAVEAQYYLGEILYQSGRYNEAAENFDRVLERYPESKVTPDAQYKKGMALLKQQKRALAAREFREVIKKYPSSQAAKLAASELRALGLPPSARGPQAKSKTRRK